MHALLCKNLNILTNRKEVETGYLKGPSGKSVKKNQLRRPGEEGCGQCGTFPSVLFALLWCIVLLSNSFSSSPSKEKSTGMWLRFKKTDIGKTSGVTAV